MDRLEAHALLEGAGVRLAEAEVAELVGRTEGWLVGLYLAAMTHRPGGPRGADRAGLAGNHRLVAGYLHDQLLARLPQPTVSFLTRTAVLDRLSGPLCDTVLEATGSAGVLASLEASNLLVVPTTPKPPGTPTVPPDRSRTWRNPPTPADAPRPPVAGSGGSRTRRDRTVSGDRRPGRRGRCAVRPAGGGGAPGGGGRARAGRGDAAATRAGRGRSGAAARAHVPLRRGADAGRREVGLGAPGPGGRRAGVRPATGGDLPPCGRRRRPGRDPILAYAVELFTHLGGMPGAATATAARALVAIWRQDWDAAGTLARRALEILRDGHLDD
jgi:hypothetical protein